MIENNIENNRRDRDFRTGVRASIVAAALLIAILVPTVSSACPVCYGAPGDPMVEGTNRGVWVLLGFVGVVQIGFAALFWTFWRRARAQKRFREQFRVVSGAQ